MNHLTTLVPASIRGSLFRHGVTLSVIVVLACACRVKKPGGDGSDAGSTDGNTVIIPSVTCEDPSKPAAKSCKVTTGTAMPVVLGNESAVIQNGYAYILGGSQNGDTRGETAVYVATIGANDALGNWTTTAPLPHPISRAMAAATDGFLYSIGGITPGSTNTLLKGVNIGTIEADGSISSWRAGPDLPEGRASGAAVVVGGFLYSIGGYSDVAHGDAAAEAEGHVFMAAINSDGSLGAWTATKSLPGGRSFMSASTVDGRIYVVGGVYSGAAVTCEKSKVLVGFLNSDGTVKSWSATTPWKDDMRSGASAVVGKTLVVAGGLIQATQTFSSSVLAAPINADGSLGVWKIIASLPHKSLGLAAASSGTSLFVFGGTLDNGFSNESTIIAVAGGTDLCAP
jgi:N-acetylneuraminic acid mutarotase